MVSTMRATADARVERRGPKLPIGAHRHPTDRDPHENDRARAVHTSE